MTSIPASNLVNVTPNVVSAGGTGLDLSGLFLTTNARVPSGTVATFISPDAVSDYFGPASAEYAASLRYFSGFDNSTIKPGELLFASYALNGLAAFVRGGDISKLAISDLQDITGTLTLSINGTPLTTAALDFSSANSFTDAAAVIQTGIGHADAHFTGSITGTTMTVTAKADGSIAVGQVVSGTGITAGTKIVALGTGTGGTGTYIVDKTQTATSTAIVGGALTVSFDVISGGFLITGGTPDATNTLTVATEAGAAPALKLSAATGAIVSQGANIATPAGAMAAITASTQNFVNFATIFKPSIDDMVAFSAWANSKAGRFPYAMWDNDVVMTQADDSASALGMIKAAQYAGTIPFYAPVSGAFYAAFVMGIVASIDFTRPNGRVNIALRSQAGLLPTVTDETIANQIEANGGNFYGSYATAADEFIVAYPGAITGPFLWVDSAVNEIWMINEFQLALMELLTQVTNIPYNTAGYALIEQALADPIAAAVSFGAIRAGVPLSSLQAAEVNNAAGVRISDTITQVGWYLQVAPASPEVRAARGSPPITFWYTDGQSVQRINMNSVEVQ